MMRRLGPALAGAAVLLVFGGQSCAIRVGTDGPPEGTTPLVPSACKTSGDVKKLAFGKGSQAFAFLWDKDHYVVAYTDPSTGAGDIYVARVGADGATLGGPVVVQATPAKSDLPNLIKAGDGYVVVWQEGSAGSAVFAHALGPDATPTGSGATIASTQSDQSRPVLARAPGGKLAVTWEDAVNGQGAVQVALLDPGTLAVSGGARVAPSDVDGWPWIAGDDDVLGLAWSDKASASYDVKFARIDPAAATVGATSSLRGAQPKDGVLPRLMRTTDGFMAAWEDTRGDDNQIFMQIVDATGKPVGGGLVEEPDSGDANWPNMAWTGAAAGVVYYQFRDGRPQIFMSFVDRAGARVGGLHDLQVSNGTGGSSKYPDVVWTGSAFGVMYVDSRDGAPGLYLQTVTCVAATDAGAPDAPDAP